MATASRGQKRQRELVEPESAVYNPTHLHRCVGYTGKGASELDDAMRSAFSWVKKHFLIPSDFETNKTAYGALSGTCYEERAVAAFEMGLLEPSIEGFSGTFCRECGEAGHLPSQCPEVLRKVGGSWRGWQPEAAPQLPPQKEQSSKLQQEPATPGDPAAPPAGIHSSQSSQPTAARGTPQQKPRVPQRHGGSAKKPRRLEV